MKYQNNFCIIGYGNHAKSKILPALLKVNKNIIYIITNKEIENHNRIIRIQNIDIAFSKIKKDTLFILATPPHTHYNIAKKILLNNHSVLIEKPALLYKYQINNLLKIKKNNFFYESFMYKFTNNYEFFKKNYLFYKKNIKSIHINFLIPPLKYSSFRNLKKNKGTIINDMSCYALSLINELNININKYKIVKIKNKLINNKERINIRFTSRDYIIYLNIGFNKIYENNININLNNNDKLVFEKVFFGVKQKKYNIFKIDNKLQKISINDINAFEKMFSHKKSYFKNNFYYNIIYKNTKMLENLRKQYKNF